MIFRYRVVLRDADGLIGPTLHEQVISATTIREAVAAAHKIDINIGSLGGNALYLVDANERPVWSLHVPGGQE